MSRLKKNMSMQDLAVDAEGVMCGGGISGVRRTIGKLDGGGAAVVAINALLLDRIKIAGINIANPKAIALAAPAAAGATA